MFDLIVPAIILLFLFILVSSVATWVVRNRTERLQKRVIELDGRIDDLTRALSEAGVDLADQAAVPPARVPPAQAGSTAPAEAAQDRPGQDRAELRARTETLKTAPLQDPAGQGVWTNTPPAPFTPELSQAASGAEAVGAEGAEPGDTPTASRTPEPAGAEENPNPTEASGDRLAARSAETVSSSDGSRTLEHNFGARLPVWIGGVAFALGGLFLVKYSIDNNLLSPLVRVILGGLLGLGLLAGGDVVRQRPGFANGRRIAQSLSGAGIAVLYAALYAATSLYQLLAPVLGFAGMTAVTATAIVLSLRYGKPIALLGMICGFLTPALVQSSEPSATVLFSYLFCLLAGSLVLIRRQDWWDLALPALGAGLGWAALWIVTAEAADGNLALGIFLLAVAGLVAFFNHGHQPGHRPGHKDGEDLLPNPRGLFDILGLGGSTLMMAAVVARSEFGDIEWLLSALFALGGILLAHLDDRQYRFLPWISLAANAMLLFLWPFDDLTTYVVVLGSFALLLSGSGYRLFWKADRALPWAGLSAVTALGFYLLAYTKLHLLPGPDAPGIHNGFLWAGIALGLSAIAIYSVRTIQKHFVAERQKEHLVAIFAVAATAFVSLALTVVLDEKNLPLAFSAEVLAVAWICRKTAIAVLRPITGILALAFAGLLVPQILLLVQLAVFSLIELELSWQQAVPIVEQPLLRLGLPAAFFIGAALFLRRKADGPLVRGLETAAVALGAVTGYYLVRHLMHVDANVLYVKAGFLERGIITNVLFLYGLFCLWTGRRFLRVALSGSGALLCGIALFRIGYFDLFLYNPLWSHQEIAGWPLLNSLLLPFALPAIWCLVALRELGRLGLQEQAERALKLFRPVPLLLAFVWITLVVRHFFQGSYLDAFGAENAEIYSYSVAWILFGITLLAAGIARRDQTLRYASLAVMLLSVCKVFLYDTAELEGLYRVFSFFGLGFSLLGLSYVYSRFVFAGKEPAVDSDAEAAGGGPTAKS